MGFIFDLTDHETDLTTDGYQFLVEYYGLEKVAKLIEDEDPNFVETFKLGQSIVDWLKVKGEFAIPYTQ